MKLLVLGGTVFLGRHVVDAALADGHDVTIFTRGKTNADLFPEVEHLTGDRDGDLGALAGRVWDGVVDTSGYVPRVVRQSAELLHGAVGRYVFVSSISVYADPSRPIDETSPVAELEDPASEDVQADYGALKAACERVVDERLRRARRERAGRADRRAVRPDGAVHVLAAPARGRRRRARARAIRLRRCSSSTRATSPRGSSGLAEHGPGGVFNATGPAEPLTLGALLDEANDAVGAGARLVWTDEQRLLDADVQPWMELPLWLPGDEYSGMLQADNRRAIAAGLTFRPVRDTVLDTLAWSREAGEQRPTLTREKERELLAGA